MTRIAQLLLLVAAVGLWVSSRMTWAVLQSADGLGQPKTTELSGSTWSAALVPVAALCAAAALAPLAVRGWALRVLAVLLALVSAGLAYLAISLMVMRDVAEYAASVADVPIAALTGSARNYPGAVVVLVAAVLTLVAAVLLLRAATHPASASKYVAPATRREDAVRDADGSAESPMSERMIWDALDEGRDPTTERTEGR